jgi:hypothetical protein
MIKLSEILKEIGEASADALQWTTNDNPANDFKRISRSKWPSYTIKTIYTAKSEIDPTLKYDITFDTQLKRDDPNSKSYKVFNSSSDWVSADKIISRTNVGFKVSTDLNNTFAETNLNEQYRLMATVIECILDFVSKVEGLKIEVEDHMYTVVVDKLLFAPKADNADDISMNSRRARLYTIFVKKNMSKLPFKTTIRYYQDVGYFEIDRNSANYTKS